MDNTMMHGFRQHIKAITWLALISFLGQISVSVAGSIIADPSAPSKQQPIVLQAANGVPLVNIQTPSPAGVSRNSYSQFDVDAQGAILNNAHTNTQTQLGGWVQSNPLLAGGTARVILNEVNSSAPSLLNGFVEVAGSKAQVVIANPSGVSCDGCGFINANRASLTTGTPILNGGNLDGYLVERGIVTIKGAGLDSSQTNYTDLIARTVAINAEIWANDLNVTAGANQVNINQSAITPIAGTDSAPTIAIDVAALGGMYAGKIHLVGTENGVGVHNAGSIAASAGELTLTVDGALINTGQLYGDHVAIHATDINNANDAVIAARERLDLGVSTLNNSDNSLIFSAGDIAIGGALDSQYLATGQADSVINSGADIDAGANIVANVTDFQNRNAGLVVIQVDDPTISTGEISPRGSTSRYDVQNCSGIGGGQDSNSCVGAGSFEDYTWFTMNATPSHTEVVSTAPAHISAGSDIIVNGNITNQDSSIMAGGTIDVSGGSVTNSATQGQNITHYTNGNSRYTWVESCGTFGGSHCREWSGVSAYNPAPKYDPPYDLATVTFSDSTTPSLTTPSNSLFTHSPDVTSHYLIETDPRFVNYRDWLSSDYMLTALSYDPALTQKRLGDGFYEQRLIREQIAQLTGRRFLDGYASDEAQYQALMNNAVTVAEQWDLRPGIALSPNQVAQLTSDIVWLVARDITLADGTQMNALVPQVYARTLPGDLHSSGSLLSANTLHLNLSGDLSNSGTLAGRDVVIINSENIHNIGGRIQANSSQLDARNDLNNIGGTFAANKALTLNAGHNLRVETTTHSSQSTPENNSFSRTSVERIAGLYATDPNGVLVANAANDLNFIGATLTNKGVQSQTSLTAGRDLNLGAVTTATQEKVIWDNDNHRHEGTSQDNGSLLQGQGGLTLQAGHNINVKAASVNAGQLTINAVNDIQINTGNTTHTFDEAHKITSKGLLSSKVSISRHTLEASKAMGSTLSADSVKITSGHNLTIVGSNIVSSQNTNLSAINDVSIKAAQQTFSEKQFNQTQRSGLISSGGVGFTIGRQNLATTDTQHQINNAASTVGSLEGNVNLEAGKAYQQTASDVLALQGNINITAQKVDIAAATDVFTNEHTTKFKQTGITVAITSPVISAIQTAQQMSQAASQTSDSRMQLLAAGTVALSAKNAANATMDALNAPASKAGGQAGSATDAANQVGGINLSLSLGTSKSSRTSTQTNTSVASSHLTAGGDTDIKATGADTNTGATSDINIIGSQVKANGHVTLSADNNLNLLAASNTSKLDSNNKNSSASIGIGVGSSGFAVTASASAGKGQEKGNGTTWTETVIQSGNQAGDKITLNSGADTNLIGAQVTGNQVIANVGTKPLTGGNLNIQSLQDTDQYSAQQKNMGFSISVPIGLGVVGGSISASSSKTKSNYQSVQEQAGIFAGDGGFQVNVAGNTDLQGAVIASTDKAIRDNKNSLTTQTLTTSNIENKAKYDAKAASATIGSGLQAGLPQLSGAGLGSDSGKESSTTVSAITQGAVNITDSIAQQILSGKDSQLSVATLNRDVTINEQGEAVNSHGNSTAGTITPIFDKEKVAKEIQAQVQITQAFSQQAPIALNSFVQEKTKPYTDAQKIVKETEALLAKANASDDSQSAYKAELQNKINQAYETIADTQDDYEKWKENGEYRIASNIIIAAISGGTSGVATAVTKESLSWAADVMRQNMIEDSKKFPGICVSGANDCISNKSGNSVGVNGDGEKVAGGRVVLADWCKAGGEGACVPENSTRSGYKENADGTVIFRPKDVNGNDLSINEFIDQHQELRSPLGGVQGGLGQMDLGVQFEYAAGSFWDKLAEAYSGTHDTLNSIIWYDKLGNGKNLDNTLIGKVGEAANYTNVLIATPFAYSVLLPPEVWNAVFTLIKPK